MRMFKHREKLQSMLKFLEGYIPKDTSGGQEPIKVKIKTRLALKQ